MEEIESAILEFINDRSDYTESSLDRELEVSEILDSLDYLEFILHLEEYLDVEIPEEISEEAYSENFGYLESKVEELLAA